MDLGASASRSLCYSTVSPGQTHSGTQRSGDETSTISGLRSAIVLAPSSRIAMCTSSSRTGKEESRQSREQ